MEYYFACDWDVRGKSPRELGVEYLEIFTPAFPCSVSHICNEETVGGINYVITYLTITNPIDYAVNASVAYFSPLKIIVTWHGTPKSKIMNST